MPVTGLNPEKCRQRNSIAAKRDGVNAVPIRFLRGPVQVGQGATSSVGTIPASDEAALTRINALRGDGAEPLTLDDVWIHPAEAANSSFIADRYASLSTSTLKNIAKDAQAGFAFMNSHRTGDLSHPSELPYGRTIAGRYEKMEDGSERSLIMFYMLRAQFPNGQMGPSTDALHAGIDGGTIFDVSVGLYGGSYICDVCGGDMSDWDECDHVPGTDYNMSDEEMEAQKARGIPDGFASYTYTNAHCGETSAVYDGAVTGAGFRKALQAQKAGKLSARHLSQARNAYANLLSKGDLSVDQRIMGAITAGFNQIIDAMGMRHGGKHGPKPGVQTKLQHDGEDDTPAQETDPETENAEQNEEEQPAPAEASETEAPASEALSHPVLAAALALGIDTAEKLSAVSLQAADGRVYLSDQRTLAKKLAVVAFGNATEAERTEVKLAHDLIDLAPLAQVKQLCSQYERIAIKLGLRNEAGTAMSRHSLSAELPTFASDVAQSETSKGEILLPASAIYEKRKQEARCAK